MCQVRPVERTGLYLQHAEQVAPLPIRGASALAIPPELGKQSSTSLFTYSLSIKPAETM